MTQLNYLPADLKAVNELIYTPCGLDITHLKVDAESVAYGACSFLLNGKSVLHRVSKITPTKTGQFVTVWKRNNKGITEPFDFSDVFELLLITARSGTHLGQFVFPKQVLVDKGIITQNGTKGKRGFRVYPPWDIATNKQAIQTQLWQSNYFVIIEKNTTLHLDWVKIFLQKV